MNDDRLRDFLHDTLALWAVRARVEPGRDPVVAQIVAEDGTTVSIERPAGGVPARWVTRSARAGEARAPRPRACASVVGLLNALRAALGVERGAALRIAPPPDGA